MTAAVAFTLVLFMAAGFWWLDTQTKARSHAFAVEIHKLSQAGAERIATEIDQRLGTIGQDQTEIRDTLRTQGVRLAAYEASLVLVPVAIDSLRKLLGSKFEEWEERQVPAEGAEIALSSLNRIRNHREHLMAMEEASLKKFTESIQGGSREPLIRVKAGD